MVKALILAAVLWPIVLGAAVWQRAGGDTPTWTVVVYLAGSRICHQRPERTFHLAGEPWPVCGRCSGLYLAAPVGALLAGAVGLARRQRRARMLGWLAVSAVPTVLTLALEWSGLAAISNLHRFVSAVPLGAMVAWVVVRMASTGPRKSIG